MEAPPTPAIKIVFLGESGAGKTSLITRYIDSAFTGSLSTTIGAASSLVKYSYREQKVDLVLWDTAGQERYRALTPMYYRDALAAVIVFDITSRESFDQVQGWINELESNVGNIVIIICGNKNDLDVRRHIAQSEAEALADIVGSFYCETSAMTGFGIDHLIQMIVNRVAEEKPGVFGGRTSIPAPHVVKDKPSDNCC
jgi:small GTP-binding protein